MHAANFMFIYNLYIRSSVSIVTYLYACNDHNYELATAFCEKVEFHCDHIRSYSYIS